ncbi:forkhead box protein N1-like [Dugong dugon]
MLVLPLITAGFLQGQDWVMVSLLPPQPDVTLPGPTRLEGEPQGDLMQAPGLPGSPAPQSKHAGFSCSSSFVPDGPPERAPSLPPHSPSIASPGPEQVQGHCPAGPSLGPFRLSPSDKYPSGFGFEEGPAGSPGRFLKGSHVPFHLYKRHFHDDVFPDAQTALALDGHSFKTPGSLEAFEEIPVDVGDTEAFLPGFSAEAWCNGLPYPSQEHSPQVLVSTSGQWASHHPHSRQPRKRSNSSPSLSRSFHSGSVCAREAAGSESWGLSASC